MTATAAAPPPAQSRVLGYAGWFLAAMLFFYAWVLRVSPSVMVEQLMRDFAVSGAILGNLSAFYFYAYAGLQMPVGLALDRWGPRRVLTAATVVAALGCAAFATASSVEMAYLGRTLIGAGAAFGFVGSMVLAAAWFPPRRFALLSGLGMGIGILGGVGGQAPLALLVEFEGWRASILMLAGAGFVLGLLILLVVRDRPAGHAAPPVAAAEGGSGVLAALWQVARRPQTLVIATFTGLLSAPMLAFGALWGVPYAMTVYGVGRPEAAFAISSSLFGFVLGSPFWGWFSDRIGRRKPPLVLGALIAVTSMVALIYTPGLPLDLFRVILFVNGFAASSMVVSYAAAREHNAAGGTGAALGLVNMAAVAGGAIFQPIIGLLLDLQWDGTLAGGARVYSLAAYQNAFIVLPAIYAGGVLFALAVRETRCRPIAAAAPA